MPKTLEPASPEFPPLVVLLVSYITLSYIQTFTISSVVTFCLPAGWHKMIGLAFAGKQVCQDGQIDKSSKRGHSNYKGWLSPN